MAEATLGASDQSQGPVSVSTSSIQAQLERILASPDFNVPERARTFLKYIVTETLSGRADRIKAYSIAVEVFGRDTSFDPQSDPVVRIEAGRIRRALERYYLTSGSSDPIAIAIPKGSYVPVFSSRGEELRSEQQRPVSIEPKPAPPAEASHDKWRRRTRSLRYLGLRSNRSCPCRMGRVPMAQSLHASRKSARPASMPVGQISRNFWSSRFRMRLEPPKAQPSPSA